MKHKLINLIAVVVITAFTLQGLAWEQTKGEGVSTGVETSPTPLSPSLRRRQISLRLKKEQSIVNPLRGGSASHWSMGYRLLTNLRPQAAGERGIEVLGPISHSEIVIGGVIDNISEVPGLQAAIGIVQEKEAGLWDRTSGLICGPVNNQPRFRWAGSMPLPMQLCRINGQYEILLDETYRNNNRLNTEIAANGWAEPLALHQALFLDMALRHLVLLSSGNGINNSPAIAVEAAKVMAARAWFYQVSPYPRNTFLGAKARQGLSGLLDEACPNGHPGRFMKFYKMIFTSGKLFPSSAGRMASLTALRRLNFSLRDLMPNLKGESCNNADVIPLVMEINPIDGRRLAGDICAVVERDYKAYSDGYIGCEWPDTNRFYPEGFRLSYMQELALFKAIKDDPLNNDPKNALVHCHALTVLSVLRRVASAGFLRAARMDSYDLRQVIMTIFATDVKGFKPTQGTRFNTYLMVSLDPRKVRLAALHRYDRKLVRGGLAVRQFFEYDDDNSEDDTLIQQREPTPVENILTLGQKEETMRLLAVLPPRERLFIKLLYGIRFEGDPARPWNPIEIGQLCGISRQAVEQAVNNAMDKMKTTAMPRKNTPNLDDADIYLATEIGMSPSSRYFSILCRISSVWLRINEAAIRILMAKTEPAEITSPWALINKELTHSNENQKNARKSSQKTCRLSESERQKYRKFKDLATEYVFGKNYGDTQRDELLKGIEALGPLRAPVTVKRVAITRKKKQYTRRELCLTKLREGREWIARNIDFNDIVYIIPTIIDGRLNIEVRNSLSRYAPSLYNSYWDRNKGNKGGAVDVSGEYADFFTGGGDTVFVPSRQLVARVLVNEHDMGRVPIFERGGVAAALSTDRNYAYLNPEAQDKPGRLYWISAFKDGKDRGVTIHLNPGGPVLGKAYYVNGEFVPEPGPLLRSAKCSILTSDRTHNLIERLKALSGVEGSEFVVRRPARRYSKTKDGGEARVDYNISPFGSVNGKISYVKVSSAPGRKYYHVKFIPSDNSFEIYPTEGCRVGERVARRFYDLDTLDVFGAREELKRRFGRFMDGALPNPVVVEAQTRGRGSKIQLTDELFVYMGIGNAGKSYFVVFGFIQEGALAKLPLRSKEIRIYEMDKELKKGGRPFRLAKRLYVYGGEDAPVLEMADDFKPYQVAGAERIEIQDKAYELGYTTQPSSPLAPEEERMVAQEFQIRLDDIVGARYGDAHAMSSILRPVAAGEREIQAPGPKKVEPQAQKGQANLAGRNELIKLSIIEIGKMRPKPFVPDEKYKEALYGVVHPDVSGEHDIKAAIEKRMEEKRVELSALLDRMNSAMEHMKKRRIYPWAYDGFQDIFICIAEGNIDMAREKWRTLRYGPSPENQRRARVAIRILMECGVIPEFKLVPNPNLELSLIDSQVLRPLAAGGGKSRVPRFLISSYKQTRDKGRPRAAGKRYMDFDEDRLRALFMALEDYVFPRLVISLEGVIRHISSATRNFPDDIHMEGAREVLMLTCDSMRDTHRHLALDYDNFPHLNRRQVIRDSLIGILKPACRDLAKTLDVIKETPGLPNRLRQEGNYLSILNIAIRRYTDLYGHAVYFVDNRQILTDFTEWLYRPQNSRHREVFKGHS
jgi:DNA-directed RNA polymerase specialized sigma24 family protein